MNDFKTLYSIKQHYCALYFYHIHSRFVSKLKISSIPKFASIPIVNCHRTIYFLSTANKLNFPGIFLMFSSVEKNSIVYFPSILTFVD